MCGIAGAVTLQDAGHIDGDRLRVMATALRHRGPDGEGFHFGTRVGLAFRRLAIIDLETGDQPMYTRDGKVCIVFNGEIYNYLELRSELEKAGHAFRTTSDTEVILEAYTEWGTACLDKFNGMWAIAIWDEPRQRLFLSRDRIGEKPLFYAVHQGCLAFASEIKALLAYGIPPQPNLEVMELYLGLGFVPAPWSFYRGILKLEPGHFLIVEQGEAKPARRYWDLPLVDAGNRLCDRELVERRFIELFNDAVNIRMRSDVPYGAFLSGGLDSSSVLAVMSELSAASVRTFTIGFEGDPDFDERALARATASAFATQHYERSVTPSSFEAQVREVVQYFDEPFADSSAVPTGQVAALARQHVKMALTGDGGDEALSGYTSYQGIVLTELFARMPAALQWAAQRLLRAGAVVSRGNRRFKFHKLADASAVARQPFTERMIGKFTAANPRFIHRLAASDAPRISLEDYLRERINAVEVDDDFYRLMYLDLTFQLPEDMLTKVDRACMAHSLETRMPFLDHRLVEFLASVDKAVKLPRLERKAILRSTIGQKLPAEVLRAGKRGFSIPLRTWFRAPSMSASLDALCRDDFGLNNAALRELADGALSGLQDNSRLLWSAYVLREWAHSV